jgi:hypothetical protein
VRPTCSSSWLPSSPKLRVAAVGVGAALGYGINSRTVSAVSEHAHGFFTDFPIALDAIDVQPL